MPMDLAIANKTALITGGDSGIGWETARVLLEEGADVIITDIDQERLDDAAKKLGQDVKAFAADLTNPEDVKALKARIEAESMMPDIVVNCAGITGAQGAFHEIDDAGWFETINVDLLAAVRVVRIFLHPMRERGWGRIVFVASEDAVQPYADELPYCAAKAGILALAKGMSKQYAREGVLVNTVSPAFIATPMTDAMMKKRSEQKDVSFDEAVSSFLDEERPAMALKRRGEPEEVAAVIAFLCSERASFVNGSNYRVDSGSVDTV